jgi:hypothetical protein
LKIFPFATTQAHEVGVNRNHNHNHSTGRHEVFNKIYHTEALIADSGCNPRLSVIASILSPWF